MNEQICFVRSDATKFIVDESAYSLEATLADVKHLLCDDCFMMSGYDDDILRRPERPARQPLAFVSVVVAHCSIVKRICQDRPYRVGVPRSVVRLQSLPVQLLGDREHRSGFAVCLEDPRNDLRFFGVDGEHACPLLMGVPVRAATAVPFSIACTGEGDGRNTLGGHLPLQLGEHKDDLQHSFADCRRCVELFVFGDEGDMEILQLRV